MEAMKNLFIVTFLCCVLACSQGEKISVVIDERWRAVSEDTETPGSIVTVHVGVEMPSHEKQEKASSYFQEDSLRLYVEYADSVCQTEVLEMSFAFEDIVRKKEKLSFHTCGDYFVVDYY